MNKKKIVALLMMIFVVCFSAVAFASAGEAAAEAVSAGEAGMLGMFALAAGIAIAVAAAGGGLAQGKAIAAALEGIARNPGAADKVFMPMIVGLALIESLVIYALVIAFMLVGKLP